MKAILELGYMPDSCSDCPLSTCHIRGNKKVWECVSYEYRVDITDEMNNYRKNIGCPLKEVPEISECEEKLYCPSCYKWIDNRFQEYCDGCGQKLSWEAKDK